MFFLILLASFVILFYFRLPRLPVGPMAQKKLRLPAVKHDLIPILQIQMLRLQEVEYHGRGHTAGE